MIEWIKINGKCPYCNKETVERNNSVVLTSYPAQNEYRCTTCNKVWSACNNADAVKKEKELYRKITSSNITSTNNYDTTASIAAEWTNEDSLDYNKETSSIVNTECIGDTPDNNFTGWGRQGWICPKCGRVMSPDTFFCLFCSNEAKTTVTTNTGGTGGCSPNYTTAVSK